MNRDIVELREIIQKLVPLLAGRGLTVTQIGTQAYVSTNPQTKIPERVNIPSIPDNAAPEFVRAIQGFIDHEVAHVLYTDWKQYGAAGGLSAKDLRDPKKQRFMNLHNIVEDTMIERRMVADFPGSARNLSDTRKYFLEKVTKKALATAKDEKDAFRYLLVPLMRALAGHEEMQEFMDEGGYWKNPYIDAVVKGLKPETLDLLKTCTTTAETRVIAEELEGIIYPAQQSPASANADPDEDGDESEDKPDQKAGPGNGTGARDHDDSDGQEPGDDDESSGTTITISAGGTGDEEEEEGGNKEKEDNKTSDGDAKPDADDDEGEGEADGKSNGSGDDEDGESAEGSGEGEGSEDNDDGDESGESKSAPQNGVSKYRTEGADGGGVGDISDDDTEHQGGGGGVGNAASKAVFDYDDRDFEEVDMSKQIAILISDEAVAAMDPSQYLVLTREIDRIEHVKVPPNIKREWVPRMEEEVASMTSRMTKDIERMLASQSHVIRTPGHRKGKLHAPSLYRVLQGDPCVFTQKQEHTSKDTAVTLLCDNSGSMGGEKMKLCMISAFALSQVLDRVKIAHEVIGFTTGGWYNIPETLRDAIDREMAASKIRWDRVEPIVMPIYKDFEERMSPQVKERFAYMMFAQPGLNGNIDGESLEYAAIRLLKRPEKRKVMLVLSDGQPAGSYKSGPHLSYMVKHLEEDFNIECIGIGIMDKSVKRFYPKNVVINDVKELPTTVIGEIRKLLM